ncbi:hypothetical protein Tco_1204751 [Tanacetum coccineum]
MDIRDEIAASKRKWKVDSSSAQVNDADDVVGCDGSGKNNLVVGGGGSDDIYTNEVRKRVEKIAKRKESNVAQTEASNSETRFETDNDEHTRISIIVNAIKNMAEYDLVKNMVENQEGDVLKKRK